MEIIMGIVMVLLVAGFLGSGLHNNYDGRAWEGGAERGTGHSWG